MSEIKMPPGIFIRKYKTYSALRISFVYQGVKCREYYKLQKLEPTKNDVNFAHGLKLKIETDIALGKFDYAHYFPNSSKVKLFCPKAKANQHQMSDLLQEQLASYDRMLKKNNLSISTYKTYKNIINNDLIPYFGNLTLQEIKSQNIKDWLIQQDCSLKTIKNKLSVLNSVISEAVAGEIIEKNPISQINAKYLAGLGNKKSDYEIEPFDEDEKQLILQNCDGQIKNLIQFGFWSGLRTSELTALEWSDIDFENEIINVNKAKVLKILKSTKTKSGIRKVVMLPTAKEALLNQKNFTYNLGKEIFHNPNSKKPWATSTKVGDAWRKVLAKINIKYRNSYQMRHSFCSMLLSNGENIWWVSTQMGHADTEMIIKIYGKWIPQKEKGGYKMVGKY